MMAMRVKITIILLLVLCFQLVSAQKQMQGLSPNGTDPTEIRDRFDSDLATLTHISGNHYLGIQAGGDKKVSNWLSFGAQIPFLYTDIADGSYGGWGDIQINTRLRFHQSKNKRSYYTASAAGVSVLLATGDYNKGTGFGQYLAVPYISVAYYLDDAWMIVPIVKEYFSLGGAEEGVREIDEMHFIVRNVFNFSNDIWLTLQPEWIIDINKYNHPQFPLRTALGKMFNTRWGLAAVFTTYFGSQGRTEYFTSLNLRYLFP
jgi:hypothetical protein